jgi:serine/threonine protein kinase/WD40 repeat protein
MSEDTTKPTSDSPSFFRSGIREPLVPTPGLEPGKVVGDFELRSLLGQGGMGQVWEAKQLSLSRQVAVKFVRPERVTEHQLELFAREARAGGRLSHTGIVAVYGHGESDGLAWIAMELVPGAWDLRDFLDEVTRMGEVPEGYDKKVAQFVAKVADAVQTAHEAGVIHRDLKPQNILITESDDPKVTDFGLARIVDEQALSHTGDFAGTYFYMSPEQVAAKRAGLDHRTDIFSLGIVLYEMLSLVRPFQGDTEHQVAEQILMKDPADPRTLRSRVPKELAVICMKALEKDRDKRFASMTEVAADLRRWLSNEPIHAKPPTRVDRATKWCRRNPTKSVAAGLASAAMIVIVILLVENWRANSSLMQSNSDLSVQTALAEARADDLAEVNLSLKAKTREAQESARISKIHESEARQNAYRSSILAAGVYLQNKDWVALDEILNSSPVELRDWEWRYLNQFINDGEVIRIEYAGYLLSDFGEHAFITKDDNELNVRDYSSAKIISTIAFDETINSYSLGGKTLAILNDEGIQLWDIGSGTQTGLLHFEAWSIVLDPGDEQLLIVDDDIRMWSISNSNELWRTNAYGHRRWSFCGEGQYLISAEFVGQESESELLVIDSLTGREVFTVSSENNPEAVVAKNGARMAYKHRDLLTWSVRVSDLPSGAGRAVIAPAYRVTALAISPNGNLVATGGDNGELQVWDSEFGLLRLDLSTEQDYVTSLEFSPQGTEVFSGSADGTICEWDLLDGERRGILRFPAKVDATSIVTGGSRIFVRGRNQPDDPLSLQITSSKLTDAIVSFSDGYLPSFGPAGEFIYYERVRGDEGGETFTPILGDIWGGLAPVRLEAVISEIGLLSPFVFSADSHLVASGSPFDGIVYVWETSSGRLLRALNAGRPSALIFVGGGQGLATIFMDRVVVWNPTTGKSQRILLEGGGGYVGASSPSQDLFAVGTGEGRLYIFDSSLSLKAELNSWSSVDCLAFSSDGAQLAVGSGSGISLVSLTDGVTRELEGNRGIKSVAWHPSGTRIFSLLNEDSALREDTGRLLVWSVEIGRVVQEINLGMGGYEMLSVSHTGHTVICGTRYEAQILRSSTSEMGGLIPDHSRELEHRPIDAEILNAAAWKIVEPTEELLASRELSISSKHNFNEKGNQQALIAPLVFGSLVRVPQGLALARGAVELDPLNAAVHDTLAWALFFNEYYEEALAESRLAFELIDPDGKAKYAEYTKKLEVLVRSTEQAEYKDEVDAEQH